MTDFKKAGAAVTDTWPTEPVPKDIIDAIRRQHVPGERGVGSLAHDYDLPRKTVTRILNGEDGVRRRVIDAEHGWFIPKVQWHFHKRLHKRYDGLVLQFGEYEHLEKMIRTGRGAKLVEENKGDFTAFYAARLRRYTKSPIFLLINTLNGAILTSYPRGAFFKDENGWHLKDKEKPAPPMGTTPASKLPEPGIS